VYVLNLYTPASGLYKSYIPTIDQWNQLLQDNASFLGYQVLRTDNLLVSEEDFVYGVEPSFKGGKKMVNTLVNSVSS
jgi:hypothetical protein